MDKKQTGFSLIELLTVLIVLTVLGAISVIKYKDLMLDNQIKATTLLGKNLSEANTKNYTERKKKSSAGVAIYNCTDLAKTLPKGLEAGYLITAGSVAIDKTIHCQLQGPKATKADFTATGIR